MMMRFLAILAAVLALSASLQAKTLSPAPANELKTLERALARAKLREQALVNETEALAREREDVSHQLVEAATQIQAREAMIAASRDRIGKFTAEQAVLRKKLEERKDELSGLLSALVRLGRNPPPALIAAPEDALKALRAAMLFSAAVPVLRTETTSLAHDLSRLSSLQASLNREEQDLAANLARLRSTKLQLESLYRRKKALLASAGEALSRERSRAAQLAEKAKSLQELVRKLAEDSRKRELAEQEAAAQLAAKPPSATEKPPAGFTRAHGKLDYPVQGQLIGRFGDADGFGGRIKGILIATRQGAQVVAPAEGRVAFAGSFRSYGQVLILDVGEGYHVLLAGMARIEVETGQSLAVGEPVGEMGEAPAQGAAIGGQLKDARPIIYVEFRKAGNAVDSSAWWIGGRKEARNQKGMN
jgi:septal ring factor EnvC (AmiA/AmiB activator)